MNKIEEPNKPETVPTNAVWNPADNEWELGERNENGKYKGEWKWWLAPKGHLVCHTFFTDEGKIVSFKRFHPNGEVSHYGLSDENGELTELVYLRSTEDTTERFPLYHPLIWKAVQKSGSPITFDVYDKDGYQIQVDKSPYNVSPLTKQTVEIEQIKKNLNLTEVPAELEKLIYFQSYISDFESYSEGFGLLIDDKSGLKTWSEDTTFLERLLPFAQANCSGSFYAFWNDGTSKPLNEMPVVVFGDEGGVHIVAENILQLMHLLTFDTEISVSFDDVYFYKNEDYYDESEDLKTYLKWIKENFDLEQIKEPSGIIKSAQEKHKENFDKWFGQYC